MNLLSLTKNFFLNRFERRWNDVKCKRRRTRRSTTTPPCWTDEEKGQLLEASDVVLHGLTVTFTLLPQLLRIQKKAAKKEQLAREELERRHLSVVLQVQHLLQGLQQEHVRRDLLAGNNQAPHLPAQRLHSLNQLATLLGAERDSRLRYCSATTADEWEMQSKLAVMGITSRFNVRSLKTNIIFHLGINPQSSDVGVWSKNMPGGDCGTRWTSSIWADLVFSSFSLVTCQHWQSWNVLEFTLWNDMLPKKASNVCHNRLLDHGKDWLSRFVAQILQCFLRSTACVFS